MSTLDLKSLASRHRNYFRTGATRPAEWHEPQLIALRTMIKDRAAQYVVDASVRYPPYDRHQLLRRMIVPS